MASYNMWIDVTACIYKSSKSYGARDTNLEKVFVGTSAKNSHYFCTRTCTRRDLEKYREFKNVLVFREYMDDICIKELILSKKTKEVLEMRTAMIKEITNE